MNEHEQIAQPSYDPNKLLDTVITHLGLRNDAALCRELGISAPVISKIRHKRLPIGASLLMRLHESSEISIRELRDLMGDRRKSYRASYLIGNPTLSKQEASPPVSVKLAH